VALTIGPRFGPECRASLRIRKFGRSANHEPFLAILIVVVDDQRIRRMYDADASDRVKHLVDLHIQEAERTTTLDDLDDLLC
jgi:hypothetical protein